MKEMDLIRLIEECGEVIQAASKILRFGVNGEYCDGTPNIQALTVECGQVIACIDNLMLCEDDLTEARDRKQIKLARVAPFELGFDCNLTREQWEQLHGNNPIVPVKDGR